MENKKIVTFVKDKYLNELIEFIWLCKIQLEK